MGIFQDARVVVLLADYVAVDSAGKLTAVGAGFTMIGLEPTGLTAPMHIAVMIDVPSKYDGQEFALSLQLHDDVNDGAVQVAGAASGLPEALRVQQVIAVTRPQANGAFYLPPSMFARVQISMGFPNGLPLAAGGFYSWRAEVDGQHHPSWGASFHVLGPPPPPVFGGPVGPASIPSVLPPTGE